MFKSIWQELAYKYRMGNVLIKLILINVAFFVALRLVGLVLMIAMGGSFNEILHLLPYVSLPSEPLEVLLHPWTIATHMFAHWGFWHILWNMLMLYWFGIILEDLVGPRRLLPIYLLGGLAGGAMYFLVAQVGGLVSPHFSYGGIALGASAAVMSVIVATGVLAPDYRLNLILLGEVKIKYIVAVLLFLDIIGLGSMSNTGGHFGHLGGAAMGWLFINRLQNGYDWSIPVNNFLSFFQNFSFRRKPKMKVSHRNPTKIKKRRTTRPTHSSDTPPSFQEKLDDILMKIKRKGYDSLTDEEKEFLFNARNKI